MVDLMSPQSSCLSKPKPFTCQVSTSVVAFHIFGKEKIPFCRGTNSLFSHCNEKDTPGQCSRVDRLPQMVKKKSQLTEGLSSAQEKHPESCSAWPGHCTQWIMLCMVTAHCWSFLCEFWTPWLSPSSSRYLDVRGVEISQRCQSHWKTFSTVGDPKALQDGGRYPNFFTQTLKNRK